MTKVVKSTYYWKVIFVRKKNEWHQAVAEKTKHQQMKRHFDHQIDQIIFQQLVQKTISVTNVLNDFFDL